MKKLIINADDFGLHKSINSGIITGFTRGLITSTSLMPGGEAFEDAVNCASAHPRLGIGVHLTLVAGKPVAKPESVKTLINEDGCFPADYPQFLVKYFLGRVRLAEIKEELYQQVSKVISRKIPVTHLDSHQHMHIVPGIIDITIDIAREFGIPAIRIPAEPYGFTGGYPVSPTRILGRSGLTFLARKAQRKLQRSGLRTTNHFRGMLAGGNMQETYLHNIIRSLPEGSSEIMMHLGEDTAQVNALYNWKLHWQDELAAATGETAKLLVEAGKIQMISFRELIYD
jgi:hopanoid biosynthesis associated protein HpnK